MVDKSGITADFSDGVLMVRVPKAGPAPGQTHKIAIRSS